MISLTSQCPHCGNSSKIRVARHWWMRLISLSRRYECDHCSSNLPRVKA